MAFKDLDVANHRGKMGVWATPTQEIQVADLSEETFQPIGRAVVLPENGRPVLIFDPLTEAEMAELRNEARRWADIMGVQVAATMAAAVIDAQWFFADPGHERFGKVVPTEMPSGDRAVHKGAKALVHEDTEKING